MNKKEYQNAWIDILPDDELNKRIVTKIIEKHRKSQKLSLLNKKAVVFVCCLMIMLGTTTVLSMHISINDIFKGYFIGKPGINGSDTVLPDDHSILKTAGTVVYSSAQDNGLKVTARGIVGDNRSLF